jgi:deferrochelatase/peroxidase EfeB
MSTHGESKVSGLAQQKDRTADVSGLPTERTDVAPADAGGLPTERAGAAPTDARGDAGPMPVDFGDIQGLLRFGFKHHTEAVILLLWVRDAAAARRWLSGVEVTSAVTLDPVPPTALQIALSRAGLEALGVPASGIAGFSEEFLEGMAGDANRTRRLGDVGASAPDLWDWGGRDREPHVAVLLYAMPGRLATLQGDTESACGDGFDVLYRLPTTDMGGVEPFGFADGLSQPQVDWNRELPAVDEQQLSYRNLSCLGEFVLGYPNEYGLYTPRPTLDGSGDPNRLLPRAEDSPDSADLGRNGSYLVIRQLRQDVRAFWRVLDVRAGGVDVEREWLASQLVGRTLSGEPIVVDRSATAAAAGPAGAATRAGAAADGGVPPVGGSSHAATGGAVRGAPNLPHETAASDISNDFTFNSDPAGHRCPLGAHIRRTNPRTADLPPSGTGLISKLIRALGLNSNSRAQDLAASTRFHRLLRRGREYGVRVTPEEALLLQAPVESGLYFMCLNANIQRQFEFVQSAWIMSTHFNGLHNESDPLLGQRTPSAAVQSGLGLKGQSRPGAGGLHCDYFSMPQPDGPTRRLENLPQFVTVAGGAYFFLPGIRALRWLASTDTG